MKHYCAIFTCLCLVLWLVYGCVLSGTGSADLEAAGEEEFASETSDEEENEDAEESIPEPEAAEFISGKFITETEIEFEFSMPVNVLNLSFEPSIEVGSVESGSTVKVSLEQAPEPAIKIEAGFKVEDEWGNVINMEIQLISRNNSVPQLLINELRTEYSNPRTEFIELKMLTGGNLGAVRVFAASNSSSSMIYQFEPVETAAGEYVVLHLRTLEDTCIDEYGPGLDESGGRDSSPLARDFWIPGSAKLLRKTDAVYLLDQDDNVLDAVMLSETPDPAWAKDYFTEIAEFLFLKDAWKSPVGAVSCPADAVDSSAVKTAVTRSVSRDEAVENSHTAADWYVTATGGASPGMENDPTRF